MLDIGCAYGTHLAIAARHGWKCFGVEVSEHARSVAANRHNNSICIVSQIEQLPKPLAYGAILLLDVIEHLKDPYNVFSRLMRVGAIAKDTIIAVTTPNARSASAITAPAEWAYRHPPSHVVYYSAESFRVLFSRLGFEDIRTTGIYKGTERESRYYTDEPFEQNRKLVSYAGILCEARRKSSAFGLKRFFRRTQPRLS
jgi:SAM-dependent methyltransferase